jgi:protein-S-isoprenylcysteine O-methyltransferase Ste14
MIYWIAFFALMAGVVIASCAFIPLTSRRQYYLCPKTWFSRLAFVAHHSIWLVAAIQSAVAPNSFPIWSRLAGAGMFIAGHALVIWARAVSPYFLPIVAKPDRIITNGPYKHLRHPGLYGLWMATFGAYLLLGQWWAAVPMLIYHAMLTYQMVLEDRILSKQ